jgi:alanine racemase
LDQRELSLNHPTWIEIDLIQFHKNIYLLKTYLGKCLYCLPIKANAYGHGLCPIGKAAEEAGVDYLAVAHLEEGKELRKAGILIPILVLGALHENQIPDLIAYGLEFTISSKYKADLVANICYSLKKTCKIHLEVDTGMQRTGVRPKTAIALFDHLKNLACFEIIGLYSHFATADRKEDPFMQEQLKKFDDLIAYLPKETPLIRHISNSNGAIFFPLSHLDMVRPALATFGYISKEAPEPLHEIAPCFTLKSKVSYFKVVEEGEGIGYGHTYTTSTKTRIVTIPIGYGDGYRRSLSNKGSVLIRGKRFPIVGTICMDQLMVDVGLQEVYVGDEVVLIGKQQEEEISLEEVSYLAETIPYEILCNFNNRIPRIYKQ